MNDTNETNRSNDKERSISEEVQLKAILDKMIEGVQVISFDWRHIYVNDSVVKQSGYPKDKLIGHTMMERYPGIEETRVFKILKECMENRTAKHTEIDFVFPDLRKAWFELSIQPVKEGIFILSIDITERRLAEEKLNANELEHRSIFEQASDGIFISDNTGRYTDVNASACTMLGYTKEELLKMSVHDLLINEEAVKNPPRFDELQSGKTLLSTRNLKCKDGIIIPVEISSKMLTNGRMLGMVRNITQRKEAEKKIRAAEEKFRKLTETAFDAIVLMDEKGNIIFWNRGAASMFGYHNDEVIHKPLTMIMPEEYRERHEKGLLNYLRTGEMKVSGKVIELQGRKKNGSTFPIEVSITSWPGDDGNIFSGIIRDISERKEAEKEIIKLNQNLEQKVIERTAELEKKMQQLRDSEEKFQKAFQASAAGITITRLSDSTMVDVNEAFSRLTEFSREELIGHSTLELGILVGTINRQELMKEVLESGRIKDAEFSIRSKSGKIVNVLSSIVIIDLNNEKLALSIVYDITERKKAQEELEIVNSELEAFTYSVSHDLRAPLRSIIGYSQVLEEDLRQYLTRETKNTLAIVQDNATKMNQLIDDLLAFAKLGKTDLYKTEIATEILVKNCLSHINQSVPYKAHITVHPLSDVYGDREMLFQVWFNLIANALKYSSKVERPAIEIGELKGQGETIFYVKDNGEGFDMQYASKLFIVFQRLHSAKQFEGTGVGLSIVKRIVNKHGGKVWAESKPRQGATFYFSIPAIS